MFIAMHLMMREEKKMELPQMRRPQKQGRQTEIQTSFHSATKIQIRGRKFVKVS
jgi:hypothetical protein